jgi:hypothetical protein
MVTWTAASNSCEAECEICHCQGEGCDGTVCHGYDAD